MGTDMVIQVESLSKQYRDILAVDRIDLEIKEGEIYGFLGLNGAGKTTTIRMLLGMIRPTGGRAYLFGERVGPGKTGLWNKVGQMVEIPYSYPELTVRENLEIIRRLRSIRDRNCIDDIVEKLYLGRYQNVKARNLSLGNKQRLGIAKAIIHRPRLLILDEPANGLDPAGIVQIRQMLFALAAEHGVTIFVSSHILDEISRLASRIGIIHDGRMIRESETEMLKNSRTRFLQVCTLDNKKALEILRKKNDAAVNFNNDIIEVHDAASIRHPERVSQMLAAGGLPPTMIAIEEEDLEHYFLRIIQNQNQL